MDSEICWKMEFKLLLQLERESIWLNVSQAKKKVLQIYSSVVTNILNA